MAASSLWLTGEVLQPYEPSGEVYRPDLFQTIEESVASLNDSLRDLSLDISCTCQIGLYAD